MIKDVMTYSGVVTKVAAMRAKLLKEKDYEIIAGMHTVTEVISYLMETKAYGPQISQIDETYYHRGNIEKVLVQSLYDDYTRLYRFVGLEQKQFLKLFLKRYEVDLIRYCLRIVFNHYDVSFDIDHKRPFFDKYSKLSIEKLIAAKDIKGLVESLKGTEYYQPLAKLSEAEDLNLFDYELALDLYYFSVMWKKRKNVAHKGDLEILTKEFGSRIDLINLQWIYRAKKYYHMLPPDIYSLLIPIHFRINPEELKGLVEAPTLEEFFRVLNETKYAKNRTFDEEHNVETMVAGFLRHIYLSASRNHPYSLASLHGYLYLKEEEIYRITTALECIRYDLSERETLQYIMPGKNSEYQGGNA